MNGSVSSCAINPHRQDAVDVLYFFRVVAQLVVQQIHDKSE